MKPPRKIPKTVMPALAGHRPFTNSPTVGIGVIILLGLLVYSNSFTGPFVYDDEPSILGNTTLKSFWTAWSPPRDGGLTVSGRPMLNFSLWLNSSISGDKVWSYHLFNLLIHLSGGIVVFDFLRRAFSSPALQERFKTRSVGLALSIALLWVVHPLATEAVTYIIQRAESLMALFYLLTLWCFCRGAESSHRKAWLTASVIACAAGMATKEVMVSAPVIVLLLDRTLFSGTFQGALQRHRRYYLGLFSTWIVLFWLVVSLGGNRGGSTAGLSLHAPWLAYWSTQFRALVIYLKLIVFPHPLAFQYEPRWAGSVSEIMPSALLVVVLITASLWAWVKRPIFGALLFWFLAILAPTSLIPGTLELVAEHRMYLALVPALTVVVAIVYIALGDRAFICFAVAIIIFGGTTWRRNQDYQSNIRLYEDTLAKQPRNPRALALLADYQRKAGDLPAARAGLEKSLEMERAVPVLNNLGNVYLEMGNAPKAMACFQEALAMEPRNLASLNNLGGLLVLRGRTDEGLSYFRSAEQYYPDSESTRLNLASALDRAGRSSDALHEYQQVSRMRPDDGILHGEIGRLLLGLKRFDEAVVELSLAVAMRPDDAELHNRLGLALARKGRMGEALAQFQTALQLDPSNGSARQNASLAESKLGR